MRLFCPPTTQLRPIRNSLGWELWVLKLSAKERNQVINMYQLTDAEATNLKKTARRTKQRESQKRCAIPCIDLLHAPYVWYALNISA